LNYTRVTVFIIPRLNVNCKQILTKKEGATAPSFLVKQ